MSSNCRHPVLIGVFTSNLALLHIITHPSRLRYAKFGKRKWCDDDQERSEGQEEECGPEVPVQESVFQGVGLFPWSNNGCLYGTIRGRRSCLEFPSSVCQTRSPCSSTMESKFQRQKAPDGPLFSLNAAIDTVDQARDTTNVKTAKGAFGSASLLLTTIRVRFLPAHIGRSLTYVRRIR